MDQPATQFDSLITFRNSRGASGRGTLIHLTRNIAVFEVYNPYSIVQMSEVLQELRIVRGERIIYQGRAVVSNLVATGLMTIVSATLVDAWSDLAGLAPGQGLREEVESFVKGWESSHTIRPPYQVAVGKVRGFLAELSRWLEQVEITAPGEPVSNADAKRAAEFFGEVESPLVPKISNLFSEFEAAAGALELEELIVHRAFARRELHPLMLCSPFVHRTYTKPLGYAGDYEMVNMMLRDPAEGSTTYAKLVNAFNIKSGPSQAHANRVDMLQELLQNETKRVAGRGAPLRVLNIGCGPAIEVQRFIMQDALSERAQLNLLDFNEETLEYTKSRIAEASRNARRRVEIMFIHKSVDDLLKEAAGLRPSESTSYDYVYCAGLFDYLNNRTCKRLMQLFYSWVTPGGLVVSTNVHSSNPVRQYMEHVLEWHLIYRDERGMAALAPDGTDGKVRTDSTGYNVFLEIRKPADASRVGTAVNG